MKKPSKIAEIMRIEMRADSVSLECVGKDPGDTSSRYRYEVVFTDTVNIEHQIEEKVELIEEKEGLNFSVSRIEPRLKNTKSSIQGAFAVTITETKSRAKVENEDLTTFADEDGDN
jgi:hypothetical protein